MVKPEGKKPVGRPLSRRKGNIKVNVKAIWWEGMDWTDLAQDRKKCMALVITVMNLWVPKEVGKFFNSWGTINFSKTWPCEVHQLVSTMVTNAWLRWHYWIRAYGNISYHISKCTVRLHIEIDSWRTMTNLQKKSTHIKYSLVLSSSCLLPNKKVMNVEICLTLKWFLNQVLRSAAQIYIINSVPSIGQPCLQTQININPYIH